MSSGLISISSAVSVLSRIRMEAPRPQIVAPGDSDCIAHARPGAPEQVNNAQRFFLSADNSTQTPQDPPVLALSAGHVLVPSIIGSDQANEAGNPNLKRSIKSKNACGNASNNSSSRLSHIAANRSRAVSSSAVNRSVAKRAAYRATKRGLDLVGAVVLLIATLPIFIIGVLVVRRTPGPILLKQTRLTRGGREFSMFKLRTMYVDAEAQSGAVWTQERDPRVIAGGYFLRRARIDELPQLLNVLCGEMSLIGPRPERPEFAGELARLYPSFARRLDVDAGISGLAQVRSGYCSSFEGYREKLLFDRLYVRHCCLWLDLAIGLKTIGVLFSGYGAR